MTSATLAEPGAQRVSGLTMAQFLRFSVGSEACAVRIDSVREILEVARITPVPLMPDCVRGVMNLRGLVVPVIDLGARLGFALTQLGRRSAVVVVHLPGSNGSRQTLGLLVDTVQEVFKCQEEDLEPPPRMGTRVPVGFVRSMVHVGDQVAIELALEQLVGSQALAALIAAELVP
jgi:purine-binding chemotaxis protein CheW